MNGPLGVVVASAVPPEADGGAGWSGSGARRGDWAPNWLREVGSGHGHGDGI